MKKRSLKLNFPTVICVVLISLISFSGYAQKEAPKLSPAKFESRSNKDKKSVILDIRTPEEIAKGHIEGAETADFLSSDFGEKLRGMDKNKKYYVYCRSGKRTVSASEKMKEMGFRKVFVLEGGLNNWIAQEKPILIPKE